MTSLVITEEMRTHFYTFLDIAKDHVLESFSDDVDVLKAVDLITKAISTYKEGFAISSLEEFEKISNDSIWLSCLEAAGVDNWGGCDDARDIYQELGSNWQL